ncbi:MAG: Serine-tRNA ligase [Parcubacteria group bacterium GW2011_GWF2_38_76]|nr:MAG: Serine-tRNA ligase [Parcubacteria group bacterium GW2011_GWF2_38_76]HBM45512.1 serine--tRNA ligase [Patescibacteria group bacterium]
MNNFSCILCVKIIFVKYGPLFTNVIFSVIMSFMLDIKFIKENPDIIKEAARKKHSNFKVEELLEAEGDRVFLIKEVDDMRAKQNGMNAKISGTSDMKERNDFIYEMKLLKDELQKKETRLEEVMKKWRSLMVQVPNVPDMSVPDGESDADNKEIKVWGEVTKFDFTPKNHFDLLMDLDMADLERGTKVSGFRGYFLKNDGFMLSMAIWQFCLDLLVKKGYSPLLAPALVKKEPFYGTGYLPQGEEDLYKTQDADYLAGTAEVGTMGFYMDETLPKELLPKKFVSFSPCFRREAGSHGKDTKGLIRLHEFYKVEQVILCEASHEESVKFHEEIRENSEEIMQKLGIPYRVVINCGGDLGQGQVKKYDIEAWVPGENKYRETHSISYFHDFQTRRLNTRYKDTDGKVKFAHSLNGTALATPRALVALVENFQNKDGSITIPEVLRPYMGGRSAIERPNK